MQSITDHRREIEMDMGEREREREREILAFTEI